jgi:imidazole glycerol-phosphate synthase subunit HisF
MLKTRIIPTLLYKDFGLVKGVRFDSRRAVGSAMQAIKVYNLRGVDELVFVDVTATLQGRSPDLELIDELADDCFMPLTVGGGVRTLDDVRGLLAMGADKVCIGSAAVATPELVREASKRFGAQCVVVSVDVRRDADGAPVVWTRSGTQDTGRHPVELARELEALGAGEVLLQSIDRDGTMEGYDVELIRDVSAAVGVPVIASGGCGSYEDMAAALLEGGASAVAAASIFHYTERTPREAKDHLATRGIAVRR